MAQASSSSSSASSSSSSSSARLKRRTGLGKRSQGLFLEWDADCIPSRRDSPREVFRKSHDHAVRRLFEALPHEQLEGREGAPLSAGPSDGPWSVGGASGARARDGDAQTGFDAVAPRLWRHGHIPGRVVHNVLGSCVCKLVRPAEEEAARQAAGIPPMGAAEALGMLRAALTEAASGSWRPW